MSRDSDVGLRRVGVEGWETGQDKSSRAGEADGAKVRGHSTSLPGTA